MGSRVINLLLQSGNEVVALSRRGSPNTVEGLTSVKCDVADKDAVKNVFKTYGPFDSVIHAIGLLFDAESGWRDASGILNVSSIHSNFFQERMIRGARAFSFFKIGISGH